MTYKHQMCFILFIFIYVIILFNSCGIYKPVHHDINVENKYIVFYYISSGNKNIDVGMTVAMSNHGWLQGWLVYTLHNNTINNLCYHPGRVKFFYKNNDVFSQLLPVVNQDWDDQLHVIPSHDSTTHRKNLGYTYFEDGRISQGTYKFVQFVDFSYDKENHYWIPLENALSYTIFKIKWQTGQAVYQLTAARKSA